jgi:hypothetical protein
MDRSPEVADGDVRLSIAIMHHPARSAQIPALVRACEPVPAQVVADPEPDDTPSPLRTAKLAWAAAAAADSTHHLVLQDDVELISGFAGHVRRMLQRCPRHAVALCVNWDSPHNSYAVRVAATLGSPWALLSTREWAPTLGFVLPTDIAVELGAYLARFPDDHKDDDELIVTFCREREVPVVAAVPHLIDHKSLPSVAGNDSHGARHAVVFTPRWPADNAHWDTTPPVNATPEYPPGVEVSVRLRESQCEIRILRPDHDEPVEHPYPWHWYEWCGLAGVAPDAVLTGWERFLDADGDVPARIRKAVADTIPLRLAVEVWAATYLLGSHAAQVRRCGTVPVDRGQPLLRGVIETWLRSGLSTRDHAALGSNDLTALVDMGMAAVGRAALAGDGRGDV